MGGELETSEGCERNCDVSVERRATPVQPVASSPPGPGCTPPLTAAGTSPDTSAKGPSQVEGWRWGLATAGRPLLPRLTPLHTETDRTVGGHKHRVEGWPRATLALPAARDSRRVRKGHLHRKEQGEEQTRREPRFLVWHVEKARARELTRGTVRGATKDQGHRGPGHGHEPQLKLHLLRKCCQQQRSANGKQSGHRPRPRAGGNWPQCLA